MAKPSYLDTSHDRFDIYEENRDLLNGVAFNVWGLGEKDYFKFFHKNNPLSYINYNFIRLYTDKITDLILSKGIHITTNDKEVDKWIQDWVEETDYVEKTQAKKIRFGSIFGDSPTKQYTRLSWEGNIQICVDYINPDKFYPIVNEWNKNIIEGYALLFKREIEDTSKYAYLVEEYRPQTIRYKAFVENGNDWMQVSPLDYFSGVFEGVEYEVEGEDFLVQTGCTFPLIANYQNQASLDSEFGEPDFDLAVKSLLYNINDTLTGIHSTNSMTRDPLYAVPNGTVKGILDARNQDKVKKTGGAIKTNNPYKQFSDSVNNAVNTGGQKNMDVLMAREYMNDFIYKSKVIEKSSDGQSIDVVQHNPMMDNSFSELKKLESLLYQVMSVSPVLIDSDFRAGALSGAALRNLAVATIKKVSRKAKNLAKSIKQEMWTVQELAIAAGDSLEYPFPNSEPLVVTVEISDGFATDPADDILWLEKAVQLHLINRQDAIATLRDLSSAEAEVKSEEIEKEIETVEIPNRGSTSQETELTPMKQIGVNDQPLMSV